MSTIYFDPVRTFEGFVKKMNEFAGDIEKNVKQEVRSFKPRADIFEDEKNIFVSVELPGLKKDDISIKINDENVLTIKGEKKRTDESNDKNTIRNERIYGEFTRSFILADNLDVNKINAKFDNGVLELTIGKKEAEQAKEVTVNIL